MQEFEAFSRVLRACLKCPLNVYKENYHKKVMKKIGALIFLMLFLNIVTVTAVDIPLTNLDMAKTQDYAEKIVDESTRGQFLREQWALVLNSSSVGKTMSAVENNVKKADPVFDKCLGLGFSWSFLFFLTLILWLCFVVNGVRLLRILSSISRIFGILTSLAFVIGISWLGITKIIAAYLIMLISTLPHWSLQVIISFLLVVFLIYLTIFSKFIEKIARVKEKDKKINQAKKKAEEAKKEAEDAIKAVEETEEEGISPKRKREIDEAARREVEGMADLE
jgi:membrane protein implicated in regulation of membrane protease activity